jgi:purine-nucleoside phosphorylase
MSTPHNLAESGDFAKTVLMPGDPLRAKFIAEHFLTDPQLKSEVRNVLAYTGTYKGIPVSVMASGMGMPSLSIYATELFDFYAVENIIRVGTAGGIQTNLQVGDMIIASGASYDSNIMRHYQLPGTYSAVPSWELLSAAVQSAQELNKPYRVGPILSEDTFYNDTEAEALIWQKMGILALEMEAAALFAIAARKQKRALAILTISDLLVSDHPHSESFSKLAQQGASPHERERAFTNMMEVALETATKLK